MAGNIVLKAYRAPGRNLAPQRVEVETYGVHLKRESLNQFLAATWHSVDNDRMKLRATVSPIFITSAEKAGTRAWSSGLRGRLVLSRRRHLPTNKLKRLTSACPIGLKRRWVCSNYEELLLHITAVTKQTMRIYNIQYMIPSYFGILYFLWTSLKCDGNKAILLVAPFKLVVMEQK